MLFNDLLQLFAIHGLAFQLNASLISIDGFLFGLPAEFFHMGAVYETVPVITLL